MNTSNFDEFVKRQQEETQVAAQVNWNEVRDEWLAQLDRLYSKVESFLSKYVTSKQLQYEFRPVEINEERIGSYVAKQMVLRIGRQEVDLMPIGTLLIGSRGRVEVKGPAGAAQLLLVDKKASDMRSLIRVTVTVGVRGKLPVAPAKPSQEIEWEWKIVTRPPERRFVEITQQTFFDLIMEVANG